MGAPRLLRGQPLAGGGRAPRPIRGQPHPRGGLWAVADQALYGGANFALNVALARVVTPEEYGAFTAAFVAFLLLGAIHGGLLTEPVLVFGAGRFAARQGPYLRWAIKAHGQLSLAIAALMAVGAAACWLAGWRVLATAMAGFAVAQAGVLVHWLLRRACHLRGRADWAAFSGAAYLAMLAAGLLGLGAAGSLDVLTATLLMGASSAAAALALVVALGLGRERSSRPVERAAIVAHGGYARYAAWTGMLEWAHGALPFIVVPIVAGLAEAAHLRAAYNLAMPALQAGAAITVMIVPALVASATPRAMAWRTGRVVLLGAVAYGTLVGLRGDWAMGVLYGGTYDAGPSIRWALAVLPVVSVSAGLLVALLRARESPRAVLVSRTVAAAAGAPALVVLTLWAGVAGAIVSVCLTLLIEAGLLALHLAGGATAARRVPSAGLSAPALAS